MFGGTGNATFLGGAGTVIATGGSGNDTFWTGARTMTITEGGGNDNVFFGGGHATVTGGSGIDLYSFINGHAGGIDMIIDFKVGLDQIALFGYGSNIPQPQAVGGNMALSLPDGTSLLLVGVTQLAANSIVNVG